MGVLALKLLLAPGSIVGVSLAVRRHGPRVGGLLGGLPVVAGPILIVLALTHDRAFAAHAAAASVLGLVSLTAFVVVYAILAPRLAWAVVLPLGWATYLGMTALLTTVTVAPVGALAAACAGFFMALVLLPSPGTARAGMAAPRWDLPLRAAAGAAMVLTLTAASSSLGPELSGLLATFPVITSVLAGFTHAQHGAHSTITLLRGMLGGFYVYAVSCFAFALALGAG
jgi:hypothetical protein